MLISNAYAAAPASATTPDSLMSFLPLAVIFLLFFIIIIRPQMKRAKEQRNMMTALQKGDEVATSGGIVGKVTKVGDNYVSLEVADNVVIQLQKSAIQALLPKGTLKSMD